MVKLSYEQVMKVRQQMYNVHLQDGKFTPFIYPWDTLPVLYLVIAICIRPYLSRLSARIWNVVTVLLVGGHSAHVILNRRCLSLASGYVGGLALTWGTLMAAVLLILHDPQQDFARLEWRPLKGIQTNGAPVQSHQQNSSQARNRRRSPGQSVPNGHDKNTEDLEAESGYKLVWQKLPNAFVHRVDWAIDLVTSFRGPNWNFRIPTLTKISAPPAPNKSMHLSSSLETMQSVVHERAYNSSQARAFRTRAVRKTMILYLMIDVVKVIMISDVYFLGLGSLDAPCRWRIIPVMHALSGLPVSFLTRAVRLVLSLCGVLNALSLIFSLSPTLIYSTIPSIVDPRKLSYSPLLDTRFYPTLLASPFPTIPNMGLAGFWGQCWHQMFRYGITEPSRPILRFLDISTKSSIGRAIQLLIAFGLSGVLHMHASYSCFSIVPSKPLMPFFFFVLQGVGIILQTAVSDITLKTLKLKVPSFIRKITNTLFVVIWLYFTGPILADDFARCGIWLFEPIPVSLIRGIQGQGWWQWGGIKVQYWNGLEGSKTPIWEQGIGLF